MNGPDDWGDDQLAQLIAASRAEADPAAFARALGRLETRDTVPGWIAWLAHPAALAASCALLVVSVGISSVLLRGTEGARTSAGSTSSTDLVSQLLGDEGALPVDVGDRPAGAAGDSGGMR
jgi:anti-sigma factor RsiW